MQRRNFLKMLGLGALAGFVTAAPRALAGFVTAAPRALAAGAGAQPRDTELATLFDLSACVGCGACVEACREANAQKFPRPQKPFPAMRPARVKAEDWSDKQDVDDRLTPYNWLYVEHFEVEHQGRTHEVHMPRRCMHCQNPPCANLCPWGAAAKEPNGLVRIDPDICLGGAKCRQVCPWHIPQRQTGVGLYLDLLPSLAGNGVMYKCDRCQDRLAQGLLPACIEACPMDAQTIGPRDEIVPQAQALARDMGGYIYGETDNGGTNTIYVSPVPFEVLARAARGGAGRPGLDPVPDLMADETVLATALAAAPLAGLAAGVLTVVRGLRAASKEADHD